ncbi:MAG: ribbon-helix-helix protein, CopG family [Deltaproteobacteria bacterium]|nr:MAG: ribbon-helix-helix protein, CopG family [Deltaproteobacteria bacterium]
MKKVKKTPERSPNSTMIRIQIHLKEALDLLAQQTDSSLQEVLERAIEQYKRQYFFHQLNASYEKLKSSDRESIKEEMKLWDYTLMDGLK